MIYGWGTNHVTEKVDAGTEVTCRYRYVSLMFIFSFVWNRRWFIQGRDRALDREVTPDEIEQMYGADALPSPGLWRRFGVLFSVGAIVVAAAISAAFGAITDNTGVQTAAGSEPVAEVADDVISEAADDSEADPGDGTDEVVSDDLDDGSDDDTTGNDGDEAVAASDDNTDTDGESMSGGTGAGMQEVAASIELVSDSNLISTDPTGPIEEIGDITIDAVYSTDQPSDDFTPASGSKVVVVEFQVLVQPVTSTGSGGVNIVDEVFRLIGDDGQAYPPIQNVNEFRRPGHVLNHSLSFEVPIDLTSFALEVGVPADQTDGYTAQYDVNLVDGPITAFLPSDAAIVEGAVTSNLTSTSAIGEADPGVPYSRLPESKVEYTVVGGEVAAKIGPDGADPGFKWLIVDLQLEGVSTAANVIDSAVRVEVDGERYSPANNINLFIRAAELADAQAVFQIPVTASVATLEFGSPEGWTGERAIYDLTLP